MTDDLLDALGGPEPDWTADPGPPPDADRANALGYRLRKLNEEREAIVANAQAEIDRAAAWRDRRCATIDRQIGWLTESLRRYHAALFARDRRATIAFPNVTLKSTKRRDRVEITDPDAFAAWLVPDGLRAALGEVGEALTETAATLVTLGSPLPDGVRLVVKVEPETAKKALNAYALAADAPPPGVTVTRATAMDRDYDVIPASLDDFDPPLEETA